VLGLAAWLRLWRIGQGLPAFLDEAIPFRRALEAWDGLSGAVDWNPHLFHYPSLPYYLSIALQKLHLAFVRLREPGVTAADWLVAFQADPTGPVLLARWVWIAADVAGVALVVRIGERLRPGAGFLAGLAAACAPTLIHTARPLYVDTLMAALAVAAVERALAWRARSGASRFAAAFVCAGLAAGCKYPAAALLAPLALALAARARWRAILLVVPGALLALATFLATTPYALIDRPTFRRDLDFLRALAGEGHFGNFERAGLAYHLGNLGRDLGWPALALLGASLALLGSSLARRSGPQPDPPRPPRSPASRAREGPAHDPHRDPVARLVLWSALLGFAVPVSVARIEVERYLAPVIPFAALLAADAARTLAVRVRGRARPWAAPAAWALIGVPALAAGLPAARSIADATRLDAAGWIEARRGEGELLVQEAYGAPVLERARAITVRGGRVYAAAGPKARERYARRPVTPAATLPLSVVGRATVRVARRGGPPVELTLAERAADLNGAAYDPRLFAGATYVLTSASVRGRHEADPARHPEAIAFYALLDSTAEVAARFVPTRVRGGPAIVIYRIGDRARRAIEARGPLPPLWWVGRVPAAYRDAAEAVLLPPAERGRDGPVDERGEPRAWVRSLAPMFADRWAPLLFALALEALEQGDDPRAMRLAHAILLVTPEDARACLTFAAAAARAGAWREARDALDRTIAALGGDAPGVLREERARVAARLAEIDSQPR
jgi:4-amino-4-deoxy-L-arabinose transferase-like glycosyltransferase